MRYGEFVEEMEKYGWYRNYAVGHIASAKKLGFFHYPEGSDSWDSYIWFTEIQSRGYENVMNQVKKKFPKIEVKQ